MPNLLKISVTAFAAILLSGCLTTGMRDRMAAFIESESRATQPDRVRTKTEYVTVPEEFYDSEACPPPLSLSAVDIAKILDEGDYNLLFVAPHIQNNEECYANMRRIEKWNNQEMEAITAALGKTEEEETEDE